MHQRPIRHLIQIVKVPQKPIHKVLVKILGIKGERGIRLQELDALAYLVLVRVKQVDLIFVNAEQRLPLVPLLLAPGDISVETLIYVPNRNAILSLGDKFVLLPQLFLEPFDLVE